MSSNTLTLRSLDIPALHRFGIGFDSMIDELHRINAQQPNNYPPYNIVQLNDDEFVISLAVAGFGEDNLNVTKEQNMLIIEGVPVETIEDIHYLHRGISRKFFRREFKLADHVEISNAHLELGILSLLLKRIVPEGSKPTRIRINSI